LELSVEHLADNQQCAPQPLQAENTSHGALSVLIRLLGLATVTPQDRVPDTHNTLTGTV